MNKSVWEIVLVDRSGQILAHALEYPSREYLDKLVERWNRNRGPANTNNTWKTARIER